MAVGRQLLFKRNHFYFVRNEWKDLPGERLLHGEGVRQGIFTVPGLEKLIRDHAAGKDRSYALYSALVLEMFLDYDRD